MKKKIAKLVYTLVLGAALVVGFSIVFDTPAQAYTSCPSFQCSSTFGLNYLGTCVHDPGHGCLYPCQLYEGYRVPGTPFRANCYTGCSTHPL